MIRVSVDRHSLRQVQKRLGKMEKKAPAVISAALNDTARTGRVMLTNEARTRYVVKSGASKKNMTIKRATYSSLQAIITAQGKTIGLSKFKATAPYSGAKGQVLKSSGLKALVNSQGNKAFAAGVTTGHPGRVHSGIFQRKGKNRYPIKELQGPSSAKMIEVVYEGKRNVRKAVKPEIEKTLKKNIDRQIRRWVK